MADTSNKVLYIDNVTTYDYVKKYRKAHEVDSPNTAKFTYVVFTDYTRHNNLGYSYHGDIFFNGSKITYINDVDVTSPVTDGKDTFIGYVNSGSGLSFARSSIVIGGISNTYELFNVDTHNITYEYVSNIGNYTTEQQGTWGVEIDKPNNSEVTVNDNRISCTLGNDPSNLGNVKIHLSYTFTINDGDARVTCIDNVYYNIYNSATPSSVNFGNTPDSFPIKSIYTPLMTIEPHDAIQTKLEFTSSDSSYIEILDNGVGTFLCKSPGTSEIACYYGNTFVTKNISVNKVNAHLVLSAYNTQHLYDDPGYRYTNCYAHYDPQGLDVSGFKWLLNGTEIGGTTIKSNKIYCNLSQSGATQTNSLNSGIANIVKFILPSDKFVNNENTVQLYAPDQEILRTESVTVTNYNRGCC